MITFVKCTITDSNSSLNIDSAAQLSEHLSSSMINVFLLQNILLSRCCHPVVMQFSCCPIICGPSILPAKFSNSNTDPHFLDMETGTWVQGILNSSSV